MTISLRLTNEEADLIHHFAKLKNKSVSDVLRSAIMEQIEDAIDLASYQEAMADHKANPQTASFDEVFKEINA